MSKITTSLLKKMFPGTSNADLSRFVEPFNTILPKYGITTKKRLAAFIANTGIESDHYKALREYASGSAYEGRVGLGNVVTGDGVRYKGRDIMQTTGRYNYWKVVVAYLYVLTGKDWYNPLADANFKAYIQSAEYDALLKEADKHNVNFLAHPELLEEFPHAVEAAGVFVKQKGLNAYADKSQIFAYSGIINKGSSKKKALGYDDRKAIWDAAMAIIPDNFNLSLPVEDTTPVVIESPDVKDKLLETGEKAPLDPPENTGAQITVTGDDPNVNVGTSDPLPDSKPVTVKSVTTSLWTKVVAGFAAITGMGINLGSTIENKLSEITMPQALLMVAGVALVIFAVYYFRLRQEAADHQTNKLIDAAANTKQNTVTLNK